MDTDNCPVCGVPCGTQFKLVLQSGEVKFFCCEEHQEQFELQQNQSNINNETEKK